MRPVCFLHIPKTAGHYLTQTLISALNELCKDKGINTRSYLSSGHFGWESVQDNSYVFTIFRNPINRTASHFIYYFPNAITLETEEAKKQMLNFVEANPFMQNYQAKYIASTAYPIDEKLNDNTLDAGIELLGERLNKIDLSIKSENITPEKLVELYGLLAQQLGVSEVPQIQFPDYRIFEHISQFSRGIRASLTSSEVEYLTSVNEIDFNLYESAS